MFRRHRHARFLESVPGIGTCGGAELLAITDSDLIAFASVAYIIPVYAGLAPVPHDSGNRREGPSREFYQRKRWEKRTYIRALIALARRLVDVVWALIRDNREWVPALTRGQTSHAA